MGINMFRAAGIRTSLPVVALVFVLIVAAALVGAFFFSRTGVATEGDGNAHESIPAADITEFTVSGGSMLPVLEDGQTIRIETDAYDSVPISRGDIVLIEQPGGSGYLVKFVKAIPGDSLALSGQPNGESQVLVNGEVLTNSEGAPYLLPENRTRMLNLYIKDYGAVPEGAYLVLGNRTNGSDDSTVFGLIDANRIKGRVLTE